MKKLFWILALVLVLVFALAACDDTSGSTTGNGGNAEVDGEHVFRTEWTYDNEKHWCSCIDLSCDVRKNEAYHTFGEWVIDEAATCMKAGTKHHTCLVCGKSVSESIPVDTEAHRYASTFASDDTNHWRKCQNSGCASISDKTAHTFGEWIVSTAATCMEPGTRKHVCTVCNKAESESIPIDASAHNYAPTFTNDDTNHWLKCQNSGCASVSGTASHTWNKENTCTTCKRYKDNGVKFTKKSDGTYYVSDYKGSASDVIIPSIYNGCPVTSIGSYAFSACTSLASITIPNSVTSIDFYAFSGCTSLASITIPDSVTSIGSSAFKGCTNLTSVTIGNGVTSIERESFYKCTNLKSITIPKSVTSIGILAFNYCTSLTSVYITDLTAWCEISYTGGADNPLHYAKNLYLNGQLVTNLVIPSSVTSISDYAFSGCTSLTSITFGTNSQLTSIGNFAFSGCTSLTSITIPNSVTSIVGDTFDDCTSLTSITIPNSVTSIGSFAFDNCKSLKSIIFNGTKAQWSSISKGSAWNYQTPTITVTCTDGVYPTTY